MSTILKNTLSEIIFRLNFEDIDDIEKKIPIFYEKIKETFPFFSTSKNENTDTTKSKYWYFYNVENINESQIIIEINKEYITIDFECNNVKYDSYNNFKETYVDLILNSMTIFNIKEVNNLGLRCINIVNCQKGHSLEWKGIISDDLLLDNLIKKYDKPSRLLSEFSFEKNNFFINFNFGIYNREFPNLIARKEFILDYDCICVDDLIIPDISQTIDKMYKTIKELFKEHIGENI